MNKLPGTLVRCTSNGAVTKAVIKTGTTEITAVLLDFAKGKSGPLDAAPVTILFKESETALAKDLAPHSLSIRNILSCVVVSIESDEILAYVNLDFNGHRIASIITSESAKDLSLAPDTKINALIKSTEVMLEMGSG